MKKFETPEIKLIAFEMVDVITVSGDDEIEEPGRDNESGIY